MSGPYDTFGNPHLRNSDRWSAQALREAGKLVDDETPVRCNSCDWRGEEADLVMANDSQDGELTNAACPKCLTDHYLADWPEKAE